MPIVTGRGAGSIPLTKVGAASCCPTFVRLAPTLLCTGRLQGRIQLLLEHGERLGSVNGIGLGSAH